NHVDRHPAPIGREDARQGHPLRAAADDTRRNRHHGGARSRGPGLVMTSALPLILSVFFGAGVFLIYDALTRPRTERRSGERGWSARTREFLVRAGLYDVSPRDFLLFSLGAGVLGAIVAA